MNDLSPERWQEIDALFAEVLAHPPDVRTAVLRRHCGNDSDLYHAVNALLDQVAEAERVLGESVADFAAPLLPGLRSELDADTALTDQHIGPYRVIDVLGRGGMGVVYLAERDDDQFRKHIALKLVKRGLDTEEILQRFRFERQVLAQLEHPGIARLYDGGVSEDGRPYFAMEYVDGLPIDAYCDAHRLTVEERLALFCDVCEAVQYAHRNLVVHRDLKPSNILVTDPGSESAVASQVKLLDFGIAKLLDPESDVTAPVTHPGRRALTPEYATPEQVRGAPVTTATDVYALGVVLYELLTGKRPFDLEGLSPQQVEQVILEQEPERASTVISPPEDRLPGDNSSIACSPGEIGAARRTSPDRLHRQLRGDLDTILQTALRKDPERRYTTAAALRDDVERHLSGLPIAARPESVGYRLRKFVSRHQAGVTTAATVLLLLAGLVTFYTVRLTQARNEAEQHAERALATVSFMEELFEGADPDRTMGDTLTVFEVLDRGALLARTELTGQPTLQSATLDILGTLSLKLGDYERAGPLLERAAALQRDAPDGDGSAESTVRTLVNLAQYRAKTGDYTAADSLFRAALALPTVPRDAVVDAHLTFGAVLEQTGRYDDAERHLQAALDLLPSVSGDVREIRADAHYLLATIRLNEGAYSAADSLFRAVLATRRALFGNRHSKVADVLNNRGNLLFDRGDPDAAEPLLQEALSIRRSLFGSHHPAVSETLNNLALVSYARGDFSAADSLLRASLRIAEDLVGRDHRKVAMTLNNIGWVQLRRDDLDGAEATFREALGIMQRVSGRISADAGLLLGNVGFVLQKKDDPAAAVPFFREALEVRRQVHGPENMHVAWRQFALAEALRTLDRFSEAEALHRESVAIRRALRPDGHADIARGLGGLCSVLIDRTRYPEAEPVCLESYTIFREAANEADPRTLRAAERLVTLYRAWQRPERAAPYDSLLAASSSR